MRARSGFSLKWNCARRTQRFPASYAPVDPENLESQIGSHINPTFPELATFSEWVADGRAGEMEYLKRRDAAGRLLRSSVQVPFPWVRSVVVCAVNYNSDQPY